MKEVLKTSIMSIGIGFLAQLLQASLETKYLNSFLSNNLITILIALLAINSTTLGLILTKIRDLVEIHGNADCFTKTKQQMILSIREQVVLIIMSILFLTVLSSDMVLPHVNLKMFLEASVVAIFSYAIFILYDTAKGVLIIIDFDVKNK